MLEPDTDSFNLLYEYQVGGTLKPNHPTYVERAADQKLYSLLKAGEFCYVLNSRQMGKSSLVVRTRQKLEAEGVLFAFIDMSSVGAEVKSLDQWYTTILDKFKESFELAEISLSAWWQQHDHLTPSARLGKFIETFLLTRFSDRKLIIVIDEIDYILKLKLKLKKESIDDLSTDDFFAFIRSCYNRRTSNRDYERLTFVLIGVATPYDLISNVDCTPFNIGQEIKLYGFSQEEAKPLETGISTVADRPDWVLKEILDWTGGQPFLTQKLCNLVSKKQHKIIAGNEKAAIDALVRSEIIQNWGQKDQPTHFGEISKRILKSRRSPSHLLNLYQQILEQGEIIENREDLEHLELKLSGLVIEREGALRVYNPIYREIFNRQWIEQELTKLRPYSEALKAWVKSGYTDESRLLYGQALQDALAWAASQRLSNEEISEEDQNFLEASRTLEQISEAKPEVIPILKSFLPGLNRITNQPSQLIRAVRAWVGSQPVLTELLCQDLIKAHQNKSIADGTEAEAVATLIQTEWLQKQTQPIVLEHLKQIQVALRAEDDKFVTLLELYRKIMQGQVPNSEQPPGLSLLEDLGLVENYQVANRLYAEVFSPAWVAQELEESSQRRTIAGRFREIEKLKTRDACHIYRVADKHLKNKSCLLREYIPLSTEAAALEQARYEIDRIFRDLEKLKGHDQIPEVLAIEDDGKFYITQEFIEGDNLDQEIQPGQPWDEPKVVDLLIEILSILEFVHLQKLAHLNLKPSNLRRRRQDGKLILIDFGAFQSINRLLQRLATHQKPELTESPQYTPPVNVATHTAVNQDIYAVGMIGIQTITGIAPEKLSVDKVTGEIIWLYEILPHQPKAQVSDELARILANMVRHRPGNQGADQYASVAEVLQQLHLLKESGRTVDRKHKYDWLTDKRILAWGGVGLAVAGIVAGILGMLSVERMKAAKRNVEQCNQPVTVQPVNQANDASSSETLLNDQVVIDANQVVRACQQVLAQQPENLQALKNQGKAYLLLWKLADRLGDEARAQSYLTTALNNFNQVVGANQNQPDPQALFYQGLALSAKGEETAAERAYQRAIVRYPDASEVQPEDWPILARLIALLAEEIEQKKASNQDYSPEYEQTQKLFGKADDLLAQHPALKSQIKAENLLYNRGSLDARTQNLQGALKLYDPAPLQAGYLKALTLRSRGFVYLLQRNFVNAAASFKQAQQIHADPLTAEYLNRANICRSNPSDLALCSFSFDQLSPTFFKQAFPILWVYNCKDYPVLSVIDKPNQSLCQP
jgi:serine/threonine protein kinase